MGTHRLMAIGMYVSIFLLGSCGDGGCASRAVRGTAGFTEAYFDTATLNSIMADDACHYLRIYNARRAADDVNGTALIIGATEREGPEIATAHAGSAYELFDMLKGKRATVRDLDRTKAVAACGFLSAAKDSAYCANFSVDEVRVLLSADGCNGVKVEPTLMTDGYFSMDLKAVKIADGRAELLPDVRTCSCTEPCPTFCGAAANYLHR